MGSSLLMVGLAQLGAGALLALGLRRAQRPPSDLARALLAGGGVLVLAALPLLGRAPAARADAEGEACPAAFADARRRCTHAVERADTFRWAVTRPGRYVVTVHPLKRKVPFAPGLAVQAPAGEVLAEVAGAVGHDATATVEVGPGAHAVRVFPADDLRVKGGSAYELEIAPASARD